MKCPTCGAECRERDGNLIPVKRKNFEVIDGKGSMVWLEIEQCELLNNREKKMIFDKYFNYMSLASMGGKYNLSKERVRQIIRMAVWKVRKNFAKDRIYAFKRRRN